MKQAILEHDDEVKKKEHPNPKVGTVTRFIRKRELRRIIPLSDTTIYEMECRGEFPRRFALTPRCVVWNLAEIEAWMEQRLRDFRDGQTSIAIGPNVRLRRTRPVKKQE
jgi:prophage regulatory protein